MATEPQKTRRESESHPCFPQPTDRGPKVWRYLSWPKFLDLGKTRTLWFARCDQFTDPAEGSWTKADAEVFQVAWCPKDGLTSTGSAARSARPW